MAARLALALLAAAAVIVLAAGKAAASLPSRRSVAEAKRVAVATWGRPCRWVLVRFRHLPGRQIGEAVWRRRGRARRRCWIYLDHAFRWTWPALCHVVAHEWGHLDGRGHSTRRGSVMFHAYVRPFWRCR